MQASFGCISQNGATRTSSLVKIRELKKKETGYWSICSSKVSPTLVQERKSPLPRTLAARKRYRRFRRLTPSQHHLWWRRQNQPPT
mmetsp:Transcript_11064/g.30538  ORF Transcript_11064/g.30538 Transcript_11064/m.30538 type:complete len:86 (+) Transcript_11064:508-765(+)